MTLRVIGAGLPRTGTTSLKRMLERLLDGPCYHMSEMSRDNTTDAPNWLAALQGDLESLDQIFDGWAAAVDWPASVFWRELADRYPDALVVLSHRGSSEAWWSSADVTVWEALRRYQDGSKAEPIEGLHELMWRRAGFEDDLAANGAQARYDEHFAEVVATIPEERLLLWKPADGWAPVCDRLGFPIPDEAPIHANSTEDFRGRHFPS